MTPFRSLFLVGALALAGCGGGGSGSDSASSTPPGNTTPPANQTPAAPTSVVVAGAAQKGPFIVGSTVLVNRLDEQGKPTTSTLVTKIDDSVGSFSFETTERGTVQIIATGYYFSELTGQLSGGMLTLRGLYQMGDGSHQVAHVNLLTHLINDRVLRLIADGKMTLSAAIEQAEDELVKALNDALPIPDLNAFSQLSLYNGFGGSDLGNAYLLALSTAFYKYAETQGKKYNTATDAELTLILNQLSDGFADDGRLEPGPFLFDFVTAIRSLSPATIAANLRSRSLVDYPSGLDVPDISVFLSLCSGNFGCAWRAGAPMPDVSRLAAAAAYDGKVYLFGGNEPFWGTAKPRGKSDSVFVYDSALNEWQVEPPMPFHAYDLTAHTIGDKIYVLTGAMEAPGEIEVVQNGAYRYDPATGQWTTLASRPTYRLNFSSVVANGKIYVVGGMGRPDDGPTPPNGDGVGFTYKNRLEVYDVATDTWSAGPPLPTLRRNPQACAVSDHIYVFGGEDSPSSGALPVLTLTAANTWSAKSLVPRVRSNFGWNCVSVGSAIYLIGGDINDAQAPFVDRYDPEVDAWSAPTRLPTARSDLSTAALGTDLLTFGGYIRAPSPNDHTVDIVEIYDTAAPVP